MANYTKQFKELNKLNADIAGGKGASLGEMTKAGVPVPPGFVILASTFDKFLELTDINIAINAIISKVKHNEIHTVEQASKGIQAMIMDASMPADIEQKIETEFSKLNTKYVAVRSSATAEDSSSAAWAGQLDSFLNTTSVDLLNNVKRCWASLFTPRAIFYRFEKELNEQKISVAVVVQKMVESEVSGIAFSVHPVTEDYNQVIIEAGFGLGEAIVSGQVTPDSYVITKEPRKIIDKNISIQERGIYRHPSNIGSDWQNISADKGGQQCLSDEQILELTEIILGIESHYGFPCDIEWAYEGGKFYIVQSRPITTLKKIDTQIEKWKIVAGDFNTPFIKNYCTALGYAGHKKEHGFIKLLGCVGRNFDLDYIVLMSTWDSAHLIMKQRVTEDPKYLDTILNTIENFGNEFNQWTEKSFVNANLKTLTNNQLFSLLEKFIKKQSYLYTKGTVFSILDYGEYKFVEGNLNKIFNQKIENQTERDEAFEVFTTPTLDSFQIQQETELKEILIQYQDNQTFINDVSTKDDKFIIAKYPEFWNKLVLHTKKYNWIFYSYMGPAYKEEDFLKIVQDLLAPKINFQKDIEKHKETINSILGRRKKIIAKLKPTVFEKTILDIAEKMVWAKPRRKDYQSKSYYHLSFLLNEVACRLHLSLEDVFSCTIDMLKSGLDNAILDKKQIELARNLHVIIPTIEGGVIVYIGAEADNFCDNSIIKEQQIANKDQLQGTVAYKGRATGIVKIINKPSEMDKMNKGDILVSRVTTPDIVPAMKKAAAIVTDKGGLTCHAAIVARELKIPCVIGTEHATEFFNDGDMIEVDAQNGLVKKLN